MSYAEHKPKTRKIAHVFMRDFSTRRYAAGVSKEIRTLGLQGHNLTL